ncbi:MAG: DMT family transporter [Alphaproteobacteria bacterium]|nr:DMT family transporter [Alphaproteobacteria bacterium]
MTVRVNAATAIPALGLGLLAAITAMWGISWPIQKIALMALDPWVYRLCTTVLSALGLFAIALARRDGIAFPPRLLLPLIANGLLSTAATNMLAAYGLRIIGSGHAAILMYTMPLWSTVLGTMFLGIRLDAAQFVGLGLGLCGIALLVGPEAASLGAAPIGTLLVIGASMAWGAGGVITQRVAWGMSALVLTAWQTLFGAMPVAAVAVIDHPIGELLTMRGDVAAAVGYGVISSILGLWAWFKVLTLAPVQIASVGLLAIPVISVITGNLALDEPLRAIDLLALVLVCGALTIVVVVPAMRSRTVERPPPPA